jgi:hypothetical protein
VPLEFGNGQVLRVALPALPIVRVTPPDPSMVVMPLIGPSGEPGPPGPAGTSVNASYRHNQTISDRIWHVAHQLGFYPAGILVKDSIGEIVEFSTVEYVDANNLDIDVGYETSGTAAVS